MTRRPPARRTAAVVGVAAAAALVPAAAADAADWRAYPLPAPPGGAFSVPVGHVGDLSFWAPNRGLMTVGGNSGVEAGLYSWDGESWHQLSTVCGGGVNSRVAWAGPTEFWTITTPSVGPSATRSGLGLCHFKDGAVVASYSYFNLPAFSVDLPLNAATCRAADDCLFGGIGGASADGSQVGAFHLRWDGTSLTPLWGPQGRGVSGLVTHGGGILESVFVGPRAGAQGQRPTLRTAEPVPALLHGVSGTTFANDPFVPAAVDGVPADGGTEVRALESDGTTAWAVGGGAGSGPAAGAGTVRRTPFAARRTTGGWTELPLTGNLPDDAFLGSVAPVPGTSTAWAGLTQFETAAALGVSGGALSRPRLLGIAADGSSVVQQLDDVEGEAARGAITAVACPTADDCWAATAKGYLYRRTAGAAYARDTDPAFQGTISIRPNEAATQVVPDDPPADDSRLFAPPVELPAAAVETPPVECPAPPALVTRVKASRGAITRVQRRQANPRLTLEIRFRLARRAKVGIRARRRGKVVSTAKVRTLRPGTRTLTLKVRRRSWPTGLKFQLTELNPPKCDTTGSESVSTRSVSRTSR